MIFISIVSHGHFDLIKRIGCLDKFKGSFNVTVFVRDNVGEVGLSEWCNAANFHYYVNDYPRGFGENNNLNFFGCRYSVDTADDFFLVLNPDVDVTESAILSLALEMANKKAKLGTINLFLDDDFSMPDPCVRNFPGLWDFASSFLLGVNNSVVDKTSLVGDTFVDWAAGSFLMFKPDVYFHLGGFDEGYFMYLEDVDICKRYNTEYGGKVLFCKNLLGTHYSQLQSRSFFSKHFFWHFKSVLRYLIKS